MRPWLSVAALITLLPSMAEAETLADAIAAAYSNNPTLEAARATARATDENFAQARAGFLPQVDLNASYGVRRTDGIAKGPDAKLSDTEPAAYGISATQQLLTGGRRGGQLKLAGANIDQAQEQLRSIEQSVLLQAISAYVDVRRDQQVVIIRTNNVEVLQRQLDEANARFEVGDLTKTDVSQAEARLAGSQAQLSTARSQLAATRANYEAIIGVPPGALEAEPPPPVLPVSVDDAIDKGLEGNPDYRRLVEAERGAKAQIQIDQSDLLPQVTLSGAINRNLDGASTNSPVSGYTETETSSASANFTIPLFEGGFSRSRVRQSKENLRRAEAQTEGARRNVISTVTAAWNNLDATRQVVMSSREQVTANELALEGTREEFSVGLRTTLDVLNAEQELLDSRLTLVRAERDAYVAAHALLQTMGALDGKTLAVNAPLYDPDKHRARVQWRVLSIDPAKAN
jgi:outer membrane protein